MKRGVLLVIVLGILMAGLATGPGLWAAPGQSPARQTVPTRTPTPSPPTETPSPPPKTKPKPTPTPTPTALATSSALSENVPIEEPSRPRLPEAGGASLYPYLGAAMTAVGFFILAWVGRRV
jgi:hypothetical protein